MDSTSQKEARVLWSFWLACGLAITGGIAPLLLAAGGTNRVAVALIPFGVAAAAMAVDALIYDRGRPVATLLYFVASIALVYGMLSMIAVPLRVAVLGTCPSAPAACPIGFEQPLTTGEESGLAIGIAMGTLAILVGFFGLLMLYRIRPQPYAAPPPVRRDAVVAPVPAVVPPAPAQEAEPVAVAPAAETEPAPLEPAPATAAVVAEPPPPRPARKPRAKRTPVLHVEPPPTEERLELAAPEEVLELPATGTPDEPPEDAPTSS